MVTALELDIHWTATYPKCPPISYLLRDAYADRWVRFHSLPESKRYPEDESEYETVLTRHNAVLDHLAQPHESLILVSTGYSETAEPSRSDTALNRRDAGAVRWRTMAKHILDNDPDCPNYWHLYMSCREWNPGCFDSILRLVADDVVSNIMILSVTGQWVLHPYDGGADVILPTTEERDKLRSQFRQWLSARADGL